MRKYLIILALVLFLAVPSVFAAVGIQKDDVRVGGDATTLNFEGGVAVSSITGARKLIIIQPTIEVISDVSKTVTTADSGKTFVSTVATTYSLPLASAGLTYSFVDGDGDTISVDPGTADFISFTAARMDDGDKITSTGVSGDSVTLSGASGVWYVIDMGNTVWTDGGA